MRTLGTCVILGCIQIVIAACFGANALGCEAPPDKLTTAVREIVQQHCGSCHDGSLQTAKPAALKVFDLREEDWTARMSDEQVRKLLGRARSLPADNQTKMAKFVKQVLKKRTSQTAVDAR
jgi:uncharacterized membrane protein